MVSDEITNLQFEWTIKCILLYDLSVVDIMLREVYYQQFEIIYVIVPINILSRVRGSGYP